LEFQPEELVLDPACGSGNFLYVTLEHISASKAMRSTCCIVRDGQLCRRHGGSAPVPPGLELNGRAVPIAELVLWIGYLQWHFRVHGNVLPAEPVLKKFDNIGRARRRAGL